MAKRANPAAIMGSLVNLKNVATHKCIALTIHIPAEAAQEALAAFGWPTMVDPVPVAIARLNGAVEERPPQEPRPESEPNPWEVEPDNPAVARPRHWPDLTPAQQTGIIRNERAFWTFAGVKDAEGARDFIRHFCFVNTCSDILPDTKAAARWAQLQVRYGDWLRQRRGAA